jgi:hypothetical protein
MGSITRLNEIFERVSEVVSDIIDNEDDKKVIFDEYIQIFESYGLESSDFEENLGVDLTLDDCINEYFNLNNDDALVERFFDDSDDDEWPDGGREDFS